MSEEPRPPGKLWPFLKNVLLCCLGFFFALIAAEICCRIFLPPPAAAIRDQKTFVLEENGNIKIRYKLHPLASKFENGTLNQINSGGFRGREYPLQKPAGTKRIIFLGDSVTYGHGIDEKDSIPHQLESRFLDHGKAVEVLNFGVPGYESEQQIELFKAYGLKYRPDMVIVGYCLNDSNNGSGEVDWAVAGLNKLIRTRRALGKRILGFFYEHSRLIAFLDARLNLQKRFKKLRAFEEYGLYDYLNRYYTRNKDPENSPYRQLRPVIEEDARRLQTSQNSTDYFLGSVGLKTDDFHSSHWNLTRRAFLDLQKLSARHSFQVVVVIYPLMQEIDRYPLDSLHRFLSAAFGQMGFKVIDLGAWGKDISKKYPMAALSLDPVHFAPQGARFASEYIYEQLSSDGSF